MKSGGAASVAVPIDPSGLAPISFLASGVPRLRLSRQSDFPKDGRSHCAPPSRPEHRRSQKFARALTPNYQLGCKRVLVSDDYYRNTSIARNVELVTEGISEAVSSQASSRLDGVERPMDVLIYGTGFRATEPLIGCRVVGKDGVEIHRRLAENA